MVYECGCDGDGVGEREVNGGKSSVLLCVVGRKVTGGWRVE